MKPKIIVVCGPTATGKSDLGVAIAKKFNGEIISADSRQVYRGLDIGTGKITKPEMQKIPHYLLDVFDAKNKFSVQDFINSGKEIIQNILKRGKIPIIVGGTGYYIDALVSGMIFPDVKPNANLRLELKVKSVEELNKILNELDPERSGKIDKNNRVRLIRAIEIAKTLGYVPKVKMSSKYDALFIGLDLPDNELKERISKRLIARLDNGMLEEARDMHKSGLTYKRMIELGLEYRYEALHLQNKISFNEMVSQLKTKIWQFAKRQRTWFKRNKKIKWFLPGENKHVLSIVKSFTNHKCVDIIQP